MESPTPHELESATPARHEDRPPPDEDATGLPPDWGDPMSYTSAWHLLP